MPDVLEKYLDYPCVCTQSSAIGSGANPLTTEPGRLGVRPSSFVVNVANVDEVFIAVGNCAKLRVKGMAFRMRKGAEDEEIGALVENYGTFDATVGTAV